MFGKRKRRSAGGQDGTCQYDGLMYEVFADKQYGCPSEDSTDDCHNPVVAAISSLLTNPALFFGALSGALIAYFILGPLLFG